MRVLHLASFSGNIGDNANHNGLYSKLSQHIPNAQFSITPLEIREYYWGQRQFADFPKLVNEYDLCIIGGGNYFELWVPDSHSGTSINLSVEQLKQINTKIFFNALGVDVGQGVAPGNKEKFAEFINYLRTKPNQFLLSVRNDGAYSALTALYGDDVSSAFHPIPDAGFFIKLDKGWDTKFTLPEGKFIGINVAEDMQETRFPGGEQLDFSSFGRAFSSSLVELLNIHDKHKLIFFPHIYRDLKVINEVLSNLPDPIRRRRVVVAPFFSGQGSEKMFFPYYAICDVVLGMRFHANVCPIGLSVPTLGLVCYPQIEKLYNEILMQTFVHVNKRGFEEELVKMTSEVIDNQNDYKLVYNDKLSEMSNQYDSFLQIFKKWL